MFLFTNFFNFLNFRGALTSKVYSFNSRPWELKKFVYYDLFDSFLSELSVECVDDRVVRVVPALKKNREFYGFISDKSRFFFDSFFLNRVFSYFVNFKNNVYSYTNISVVFLLFFRVLLKYRLISGIYLLLKEISFCKIIDFFFSFGFRLFFFKFSCNLQSNLDFNFFTTLKSCIDTLGLCYSSLKMNSFNYLFFKNQSLVLFDKSVNIKTIGVYDVFFVCDFEPRFECPSLNLILRDFFLLKKSFFSFGKTNFSNFKIFNVGLKKNYFLNFFFGLTFLNILSFKTFFFFLSFNFFNSFRGFLGDYCTDNLKIVLSPVNLNLFFSVGSICSRGGFNLTKSYSYKDFLFKLNFDFADFFVFNSFTKFFNNFKYNFINRTSLRVFFSPNGFKNLKFLHHFDILIPVFSFFEGFNLCFNIFGFKLCNEYCLNRQSQVFSSYFMFLLYNSFFIRHKYKFIFKSNIIKQFNYFRFKFLDFNSFWVFNFKKYENYLSNFHIFDFYRGCFLSASSLFLSRKSKMFRFSNCGYSSLLIL